MHSQPQKGFLYNLPLSKAMWLKYAVPSKITASAESFGKGLKVWQVFWLSSYMLSTEPSYQLFSFPLHEF